ncbi:hypothetical protein [Chitinimonas sp.]|uniref:hypothetical protein n=1 Tax=Chitinimonas sp. TaxID=1934313 RepID=UPI0035ADC96C
MLLAMSGLSGLVTATAFFIAGPRAMLAALFGGLSQIAAVWVYRRIALTSSENSSPKDMLGRFFAAEIAKIIAALMLMLAGLIAFGSNALWFLGAAMAALAAYWLVLIFK